MLKFLLPIAAVAASCVIATPAQAQSIDSLLNLVTHTTNSVDRLRSGRACGYSHGIQKIACEVGAARNVQNRLSTFYNRTRMEQRAAQQRRDIAQGRVGSVSKLQLGLCRLGEASACQIVGMTPQQAKELLDQRATSSSMNNIRTQRVATASAGATTENVMGM